MCIECRLEKQPAILLILWITISVYLHMHVLYSYGCKARSSGQYTPAHQDPLQFIPGHSPTAYNQWIENNQGYIRDLAPCTPMIDSTLEEMAAYK